MKNRIYAIIVLINCLCLTSHAQLRLLQNGRVQIGTLRTDPTEDPQNVTTLQIFGPYGDMRSGSKLTFGDFGQYPNQGWNVFIGEYGSDDTDQLWLQGKKGIYLTTNGFANNVVAYYAPSVNSNFIFNTNLRVNGVNITSDARLKENIQTLQNPLGIINQLNGVCYNYKLSEISKYREQDNSKFTEAQNMLNSTSSQLSSNATLSEKENEDKLYQNAVERKEAEDASRKRIGFLAQDIEKVLPELVQTSEDGVKSIDYIGFIPLIVESIKEMQQTIQEQQNEIEILQSLLPEENTYQLRSTSTDRVSFVNGAKLYNRTGTSVSYTLPSTFANANLQVYDISGRMLKKITLTTNSDIVEINPSEIGYGTFIYVLYVDGQKADTLKKYVN